MKQSWYVGVDIGGTFTDIVAIEHSTAQTRYLKVPSSRQDPASAVLAGVDALGADEGIAADQIRLVLHGTTLATNAILERQLANVALITTGGFRDVLEIGRTWRSELYDPFHTPDAPLIPRDLRFEVGERVDASGAVVEPLDLDQLESIMDSLRDRGVESVAVALMHSYAHPDHERLVQERLDEAGGWFTSTSSTLMREVREYERTSTTALNAALMPTVDGYLRKLEAGLEQAGVDSDLLISQSNGGMQTPALARERPVTLSLSGPVAGVVALTEIARSLELPNLVGLDMGGTSADISLISDYVPRITTELSMGGVPVRIPSIKVDAIGAGGGSIAHIDAGTLRVGPRSAGSNPGPAAYGQGGAEPTVTDAQVVLGRLAPSTALAGRLTLDREAAEEVVRTRLAETMGVSVPEAAAGTLDVVNAAMEGAVRVALRERGEDPREFALVAFGGAGAMHACELAKRLNIGTVVVPPHPGTLCALGLLAADLQVDASRSLVAPADQEGLAPTIEQTYAELEEEVFARLQGTADRFEGRVEIERACDVRYPGQAYEVLVPVPNGPINEAALGALSHEFHDRHRKAYGFAEEESVCELVTYRVTARRVLEIPAATTEMPEDRPSKEQSCRAYELGAGFVDATLWDREDLPSGHELAGPAVIRQKDSTTWIPNGVRGHVTAEGFILLTTDSATGEELSAEKTSTASAAASAAV